MDCSKRDVKCLKRSSKWIKRKFWESAALLKKEFILLKRESILLKREFILLEKDRSRLNCLKRSSFAKIRVLMPNTPNIDMVGAIMLHLEFAIAPKEAF